ncbi:MAG: hypothetical protein BM555_06375 [Crocinitomix sp. MedPE-SWsnd]|mgnify:CR=1 FL=1|jgi:hypothetical protein|nr:MAG: hypothetical protein BM555_06375 [Crocinitomix sp. MedPE-SWsnd]
MKISFFALLMCCLVGISSTAQTGHELFMAAKVKTNGSGNMNSWNIGPNSFSTITADDWNHWNFSMLGQDGQISTMSANDFTSFKVDNLNIAVTQTTAGNYGSWTIVGEGKTITMFTSNWNTWAYSGDLISGLSTVVTDDFEEWSFSGGDWMSMSPSMRSITLMVPVFTSAVYKQIIE